MTENELATIAVDICYKIHTTLGPGLLESVYEAAFASELDKRGIPFTKQAINTRLQSTQVIFIKKERCSVL